MTDLEKAIVRCMRLSETSAELLLPEIQRNIETARAELIRAGVSSDVVQDGGYLVEDCIISFCLAQMGEETLHDRYVESFRNQQENLRKS